MRKNKPLFVVMFLLFCSNLGYASGVSGGQLPDVLLTAAEFEKIRMELDIKDLELVSEENEILLKKIKETRSEIEMRASTNDKLLIKLADDFGSDYSDVSIFNFDRAVRIEVYQ